MNERISTIIMLVVVVALGILYLNSTKKETIGYALVSETSQVEQHSENITKLTKEEWKKRLKPAQYQLLWEKGTEKAFSGEYLYNKKNGVYVTAGCKEPVFSSEHKYDSGTGWPSFYQPISEDSIVVKEDYDLGFKRLEVLSKCGEHLGHVFNDGPEPTGLRYCINSGALVFVEDKDE